MNRLLCHCLVVSEREVVAAIRAGALSVEAVGVACEAGTGCGSCRGGIEVLIAEHRRRRVSDSGAEAVLAQLGLFGDSKP